jgi:hypothetical protein
LNKFKVCEPNEESLLLKDSFGGKPKSFLPFIEVRSKIPVGIFNRSLPYGSAEVNVRGRELSLE